MLSAYVTSSSRTFRDRLAENGIQVCSFCKVQGVSITKKEIRRRNSCVTRVLRTRALWNALVSSTELRHASGPNLMFNICVAPRNALVSSTELKYASGLTKPYVQHICVAPWNALVSSTKLKHASGLTKPYVQHICVAPRNALVSSTELKHASGLTKPYVQHVQHICSATRLGILVHRPQN